MANAGRPRTPAAIAALDGIKVRKLHAADPVPELTRLLHRAYARLAAMGLR